MVALEHISGPPAVVAIVLNVLAHQLASQSFREAALAISFLNASQLSS
jgi:hypothetical protein